MAKPSPKPRRLGTTADAASLAGVTDRCILNWMDDPSFGYYERSPIGHEKWLIDMDEFKVFLNNLRMRKRRTLRAIA